MWSRGWHRPFVAGLFGLCAGVLYTLTDGELGSTESDPLLPVQMLFDIHPLLGIAFFTISAFAAVWIERRVKHRL